MTKIKDYFGIEILPEPKSPSINFNALETNVSNYVKQLNNYNAEKFKVYLYTIAFSFPADNRAESMTKLKNVMCRLRIPKYEYDKKRMMIWNPYIPKEIALVKHTDEDKYQPYNPSEIKIIPSVKRIVYQFSQNSLSNIRSFLHTIVLSVHNDVPEKNRKFRVVLTCIPTIDFKKTLLNNYNLSGATLKELNDEGIKSSHEINLIEEQQINIFGDDSSLSLPTFHSFLAYPSSDETDAIIFQERLEEFGINIWIDKKHMIPGSNVLDELSKRVITCNSVLIAIGKSGIGPWEKKELEIAIHDAVKKEKTIIPVFLPKAPKDVKIPPYLNNYLWVDFRKGFKTEELKRIATSVKNKRVL
ncbi:MAG: toll/interleukin-1 receptor domain-containing protein [Melioribacteraceae bacterium]